MYRLQHIGPVQPQTNDPEVVRRRMKEARIHLDFCITLYRGQLGRGKHVVHEHPISASSWKEESVELIASHPQVDTVVGVRCQYGMSIEEQPGIIKPVNKAARWMSSSNVMLERKGQVSRWPCECEPPRWEG